jgi:hypothetical protein
MPTSELDPMTHPAFERCDVCGTELPGEEFEKGRAVQVLGKNYCSVCRDRAIHEVKSPDASSQRPTSRRVAGGDYLHRRRHERKPASLPVELTIYLEDGDLHGRGKAILRNVSLGGALLGSLAFSERSLPTEPHTIGIRLHGYPSVGVEIVGRPVRLVHRAGSLEVGMEFLGDQEASVRELWNVL